jgi:hypothetical protein
MLLAGQIFENAAHSELLFPQLLSTYVKINAYQAITFPELLVLKVP